MSLVDIKSLKEKFEKKESNNVSKKFEWSWKMRHLLQMQQTDAGCADSLVSNRDSDFGSSLESTLDTEVDTDSSGFGTLEKTVNQSLGSRIRESLRRKMKLSEEKDFFLRNKESLGLQYTFSGQSDGLMSITDRIMKEHSIADVSCVQQSCVTSGMNHLQMVTGYINLDPLPKAEFLVVQENNQVKIHSNLFFPPKKIFLDGSQSPNLSLFPESSAFSQLCNILPQGNTPRLSSSGPLPSGDAKAEVYSPSLQKVFDDPFN